MSIHHYETLRMKLMTRKTLMKKTVEAEEGLLEVAEGHWMLTNPQWTNQTF
jgi:hypothetical protein